MDKKTYDIDGVKITNCTVGMVDGFYLGSMFDGNNYDYEKKTGLLVKDNDNSLVYESKSPKYEKIEGFGTNILLGENCHMQHDPESMKIPENIVCIIPSIVKDAKKLGKGPYYLVVGPESKRIVRSKTSTITVSTKKYLPIPSFEEFPSGRSRRDALTSMPVITDTKPDTFTETIKTKNLDGQLNVFEGKLLIYKVFDFDIIRGIASYYESKNRYSYKLLIYKIDESFTWTSIDMPISIKFRTTDGMNIVDTNEIGGYGDDFVSPSHVFISNLSMIKPFYEPLPIKNPDASLKTQLATIEERRKEDYETLSLLIDGPFDLSYSVYGYTRSELVKSLESRFQQICTLYTRRLYEDIRIKAKLTNEKFDNAPKKFSPEAILDSCFIDGCSVPKDLNTYFIESFTSEYDTKKKMIKLRLMYNCQPAKEGNPAPPVNRQEYLVSKSWHL